MQLAKSSSLRSLSQEDLDFFEEHLLPEADGLFQLCLMIHLNRHEAFQTFYRCFDQISQHVGEIRMLPTDKIKVEVVKRAIQVLNLIRPEQKRATEDSLRDFITLNVELRKLLCLHDHLGIDLKACQEILKLDDARKKLVEVRVWYADVLSLQHDPENETPEEYNEANQ